MKLSFLGQAYSANSIRVETLPSEDTARFLGRTYTLRRPIQTVSSASSLRKYRGVTYGA